MMRYLKTIIIPIILIGCQTKNDFIIDSDRAGNLKLEMTEEEFIGKFIGYKIDTFVNGINPNEKYYVTKKSDDNSLVLKSYFKYGNLEGIKIFDRKYKMTNGVEIGNSAQDVINKGVKFRTVHFGEREGLRCEISERKINGDFEKKKDLQLVFSRKIYQNGLTRNIGKNAILNQFVIGKDFDIKYDTLSKEDRLSAKMYKQGELLNNKYRNDYYNFEIGIPSVWDFKLKNSETEDLVDVFTLKNKSSSSILTLSVKTMTGNMDAKTALSLFGSMLEIETYRKKDNLLIYKLAESSTKQDDQRVYYSVKIKGNILLFVSKYNKTSDLKAIDELMDGITTTHNNVYTK